MYIYDIWYNMCIYIWYMIYDIWYIICDIWYMIYAIWYMIYIYMCICICIYVYIQLYIYVYIYSIIYILLYIYIYYYILLYVYLYHMVWVIKLVSTLTMYCNCGYQCQLVAHLAAALGDWPNTLLIILRADGTHSIFGAKMDYPVGFWWFLIV